VARFLAADRLLFSVPMWNAGIPYVLKQFIDVVSQPGAITRPRLGMDTIAIETRAGARALAVELAALGYRRFALLARPVGLLTVTDRVAGFRDGLRRAGLSVAAQDMIRGDFTRDGGYEAAKTLLARKALPDCVFAPNDVMAVGAMAALQAARVHPGTDVGIAGFDDIATLRDATAPMPSFDLEWRCTGVGTACRGVWPVKTV
jgi:LacI family transcriptional regulator